MKPETSGMPEHSTGKHASSLPSLPQAGVLSSQNDDVPETFTVKDSAKCAPCNTLLEGLLKSPLWVVQQIEIDRHWWRKGGVLILWGLIFHALYGAATGTFGGWDATFMLSVKAPLIALCALGLCLPSLYIFSCVGGMRLTLSQAFALASCVIAITGLLLLGLAPVAWLFSASTDNVVFAVVFTMMAWMLAVGFALRFLSYMKFSEILRSTTGLKWWLLIYILVSFQMATNMRPFLNVPNTGWWTSEKKFFGTHFMESLEEEQGVEKEQISGSSGRN
jgi:hypothetical protein